MPTRRAPWSKEEVQSLNLFQSSGVMHSYTCARHSSRSLLATVDGWVCPVMFCGYTQDWAHEFSLDRVIVEELIAGHQQMMGTWKIDE